MPLSPGPLTIPGPPLLAQPPGIAATGLGGRLLTSGAISTTSGTTITASISPLTSVVFVHVAQRQNPNAPVVLRMESPLGGPWTQLLTRGSGADRKSELWIGTGLSGAGAISIISTIPAIAGFYAVFEFTGIDAQNPYVASNLLSQTGVGVFTGTVTPNPLQSGHNAYLVAVSQNNAIGLQLVPPGTEFLYNSNSSDGFILGAFTGWTNGPMGAIWTPSSNFRALGCEVIYNPDSAPLAPIFPRRPESFPKVTVAEAFNMFGPPIIREQEFVYDTAVVGPDATATPTTVAAVAAIPAPTVLADAITVPSTVAAIASVAAPAVLAGAIATPATVAATAAVPAPTLAATAVATPATVVAVAAVPSPAVHGGAIVQPTTVASIAAVPAPTILVGGSATSTPATVAAVATVPAPTFGEQVVIFLSEGDADPLATMDGDCAIASALELNASALGDMEGDSGKAGSIEGDALVGAGLEG